MINWWDQKAARLQQSVRADEREGSDDYSDGDLKRSVVHAREDIVLLVSHLSSVNRQLRAIKVTLLLLLLVLIYIAIRHHLP
jgi:uncharacterized integral membrane protein